MTPRFDVRARPALVVAGAVVVLLLVVANRYGYHRDELYFIAAADRMSWGYVDQPPFTVALAWLTGAAFGNALFWLRMWPALALGGTVIVTGLVTRRLGGGPFAQGIAAAGIGGGGFFLGAAHLLSTATFDYFFWSVILLLVVHLLDGGDQRWWLAVGAVAGIGLLNKHTVLFLLFGLFVGMLAGEQRRLLGSRWPWLGAGIAAVLWLPNVVWQMANDLPTIEMTRNLRDRLSGVPASIEILTLQIVAILFVFVVPAVVGLAWLLRSPQGRRWRPIGVAYLVLLALFVVVGGRFYYVAGLYVPLLGAGALWVERRWRGSSRRGVVGVAALAIAFALPFALPLAPPTSLGVFNALNNELGETVGWQQLVDQVTEVVHGLAAEDRSRATILTSNYGQAGALELLGVGLPPVHSGHNNYWLWGPPESDGAIIAVGYFGGLVDRLCVGPVIDAGTIDNGVGLENDEQGAPIRVCLRTRRPLAEDWDLAKHFN